MKTVFISFLVLLWMVVAGQAQSKKVVVDVRQDLGSCTLLSGTNAGPIGLRSRIDYTPLYKSVGFRAVRTHDFYKAPDWYAIFPTWQADPDDPDSYDFGVSDAVIKSIVDNGFEVLFRLGSSWRGRRPEHTNDPPGTIRNEYGQIIHAADSTDFAKFANICKHIVMHYNDGWSNGFHFNIKRWEIWNEPSLKEQFWTGTPEQFYQMFSLVAITLKAYDPALSIGGPGLAGHHKKAYSEGLLAYCRDHQVPLDFFSWHSYGGRLETSSPWDLASKAREYRALLQQYGFAETTSICDEWNAGIGSGNYADSRRGAAFYAAALTYFVQYGVAESYQYRGDDHPLGLVRSDGSLKRAANALFAWQRLCESTHLLHTSGTDSTGFTAIASTSTDGDTLRILIANFPNTARSCSLQVIHLDSAANAEWQVIRYEGTNTPRLVPVDSFRLKNEETIHFTISISPQSMTFLEMTRQPNPTNIEKQSSPQGFRLEQNYPNPFNPSTTICFSIPNEEHVYLDLYDLLGRRIETLVQEYLSPGTYSVDYTGTNLSSGLYIYQLQAGQYLARKKMAMIK